MAHLVGIFAPAPQAALKLGAMDKVVYKKRQHGIGIASEEVRFQPYSSMNRVGDPGQTISHPWVSASPAVEDGKGLGA